MSVISNSWCNPLNWSNLYHADAFFQFRVLIRVLELISIPHHSMSVNYSEIHLFMMKFEYFTLMESVCERSIQIRGITHLIG